MFSSITGAKQHVFSLFLALGMLIPAVIGCDGPKITSLKESSLLEGHAGRVWTIAYSPDGTTLASASDDKTVRIWDPQSGTCTQLLKVDGKKVYGVAYSLDGALLANVVDEGGINIWKTDTWALEGTLAGHTGRAKRALFSARDEILITASEHEIKLWTDYKKGQFSGTMAGGPCDAVSDVAISPVENAFAAATQIYGVKLWRIVDKKARDPDTYGDPILGYLSVAFSPDGKLLASGTLNFKVYVWNVANHKQTLSLDAHGSPVGAVAFDNEGKLLATGSWATRPDRPDVKLWDVATGKQVGVLRGHTAGITSIRFSPDKKHVATCSQDKTIRIWDISGLLGK